MLAEVVQVRSQHDSQTAPHIARVIAVDASKYITHSLTGASPITIPPKLAVCSQNNFQRHASLVAWEDDVAYMPPSLAFNLGLQYQLWPLMPHVQPSCAAQAGSSSEASLNQTRQTAGAGQDQVLILPLENGPSPLGIQVDLPQLGEATSTSPSYFDWS